jgi:Arc/MetJ family transcription regulator
VRTTVTLDDDLLAEAERLSGIQDRTPLLRAALTALVEREASRRLARLGGSDPGITAVPRRRPS